MKGERSFFLFFFSVVSLGYCCAQAFPFDARSLLHKMLQALLPSAEGQGGCWWHGHPGTARVFGASRPRMALPGPMPCAGTSLGCTPLALLCAWCRAGSAHTQGGLFSPCTVPLRLLHGTHPHAAPSSAAGTRTPDVLLQQHRAIPLFKPKQNTAFCAVSSLWARWGPSSELAGWRGGRLRPRLLREHPRRPRSDNEAGRKNKTIAAASPEPGPQPRRSAVFINSRSAVFAGGVQRALPARLCRARSAVYCLLRQGAALLLRAPCALPWPCTADACCAHGPLYAEQCGYLNLGTRALQRADRDTRHPLRGVSCRRTATPAKRTWHLSPRDPTNRC